MKKTLISLLTLLCACTMALGVGTACNPQGENGGTSASVQVDKLEIGGRPKDDTVAITDTVNTLTLTCEGKNLTWASSDTAVATVENGKVTLLAAGSTVISVKSGKKTGEFILIVTDERTPTSITVSIGGAPTNNEVLLSSDSLQLSATCSDGSEVLWFSRNEGVATVDGTGKVTLLQRGSVEIVAQKKGDESVYGVCTLKVLAEPVTALNSVLGLADSAKIGTGQKILLSLETTPADCEPFETEWTVSDPTVASVSSVGELVGIKAGNATVTATVKGTAISVSKEITVVEARENFEDFSTAVVIGNYVVGEIESRDASNALSPEIVYDEDADNYYLKYSHAKADGNNKYMIYTFTGLDAGARYVLKYNMKVLSKEGSYNHQINLYSDKSVPVAVNDPLVGNVYSWHTTGLDTETAKIYQSGSGALYRDGLRWKDTDDSMDDFHEYTLGFIAGEDTVGFAFVCNNTYEVLFDYICAEKAPEVEDYALTSTARLPIGKTYPLTPVAVDDIVYYQPFKLTYTSSDPTVATVNEKGVVTAIKEGTVTITAVNTNGAEQTVDITVVQAVDGTAYDVFYEETDELVEDTRLYKEYELQEPLSVGAAWGDRYKVTLEIDAIYYVGNVQLYLGLVNTKETLIGQRTWTSDEFPLSGEKKTVAFEIELPWNSGNFDLAKLRIYLRYGNRYQIGVNVLSIERTDDPMAAQYDLWYVGRSVSVEKTFNLAEAVTGGVRYDTATVNLSLDLIEGEMPRIKFYFLNTAGAQITDPAEYGWINVADCYNESTDTYSFTATFKWATGNWDVGALWLLVEDGAHRLGVDVVSVTVQEIPYQLEYSFTSGSQAKTYAFDKVAGGAQNGYVKVTFEVTVFSGTLTNIQFNLCTDTDGATVVANSNKAWAEDGTKITSSGGQISMGNCADKKTVTIVTTFPWASGNWDLQSIRLQLYGTKLQAGVSNIQVTLTEGTYEQ